MSPYNTNGVENPVSFSVFSPLSVPLSALSFSLLHLLFLLLFPYCFSSGILSPTLSYSLLFLYSIYHLIFRFPDDYDIKFKIYNLFSITVYHILSKTKTSRLKSPERF